MSNYNVTEDYNYILFSLSRLIGSVGGDIEDAPTITLDSLYSLISVAFPTYVGTEPPGGLSESEKLIRRKCFDKTILAKKLVFYRDLVSARIENDG